MNYQSDAGDAAGLAFKVKRLEADNDALRAQVAELEGEYNRGVMEATKASQTAVEAYLDGKVKPVIRWNASLSAQDPVRRKLLGSIWGRALKTTPTKEGGDG